MDITKKAVSTISAIALTASLAVCGVLGVSTQASAAESNTTDVTLTVTEDMDQVSWTAPTKIPVAVQGDGTLVQPTYGTMMLQNESILPIHVTKIQATAAETWDFTSATDVNVDGTKNLVNMNLVAGAETSGVYAFTENATDMVRGFDTSAESVFDMNYKNDSATDDAVSIGVTGKLINHVAGQTFVNETKFATITWTIAPGTSA